MWDLNSGPENGWRLCIHRVYPGQNPVANEGNRACGQSYKRPECKL